MTLGPQFQQLKMFMTGNEIKQTITGSVDASNNDEDTMSEMWDQKVEESHDRRVNAGDDRHGQSLYDSVEDEGAHTPVTLYTPRFNSTIHGDGHHRTAISADVEDRSGRQVYLPVLHDEHDPMYTEYGNKQYQRGDSKANHIAATRKFLL